LRGFYVNYKVPELQEAIKSISAYDRKTAAGIEHVVYNSTKTICAGAKKLVSVESGDLKKHISFRFNKLSITGTIAAKRPHAHLVEFGASAATEVPKRKKALTVSGKTLGPLMPGQTHFAAKANIPKRRAKPYMEPPYKDEAPKMVNELKKVIKKP
jgi:hypothetical protein